MAGRTTISNGRGQRGGVAECDVESPRIARSTAALELHADEAADVQADYHERFAAAYDTFYAGRDISGEVRLATRLLDLDGCSERPAHVLDFGCGTGSHVLEFAKAGIRATGFDRSHAMIARARAKLPEPGSAEIRFETGRFDEWCEQSSGLRFDGAVSLFNVLNCMDSGNEMLAHLRLICSKMAQGAKLLVEVWNAAAVLVHDPRPAIRHYPDRETPSLETIRITDPEVDRVNQRCTLRYRVLTLDRGAGRFTEFESVHRLHLLTPDQYRRLFDLAELKIVDVFPQGHPGTAITEHDWYISFLVRRDG